MSCPILQYNASVPQDRAKETWADKPPSLIRTPLQTEISSDYPLSFKRESLFLDRETQVEHPIPHAGLSLYGQDPPTAGLRSSGLGRSASAFVTQVMDFSPKQFNKIPQNDIFFS